MKDRKKTNHNFILAIIFFILLAVVSYSIILNFSAEEKEQTQKMEKQITPTTTPGVSMRLEGSGGKNVFSANEQITIQAIANSRGQAVGGYDLVLRFDSTKLKFASASGTLADFQAFSTEENGTINLTAAKKTEPSLSAYFNETSIATFTFTPLAAGTADFKLEFQKGSTKDTNLVSEKAQDILTDVNGVAVSVGDSILLQKEQKTVIDSQTIATLLDVIPLRPNCADCAEYAKVEVVQNGRTQTLEFKSGGIAGIVDTYKEAFGYGFEVGEFGQNSLKVTFSSLQ